MRFFPAGGCCTNCICTAILWYVLHLLIPIIKVSQQVWILSYAILPLYSYFARSQTSHTKWSFQFWWNFERRFFGLLSKQQWPPQQYQKSIDILNASMNWGWAIVRDWMAYALHHVTTNSQTSLIVHIHQPPPQFFHMATWTVDEISSWTVHHQEDDVAHNVHTKMIWWEGCKSIHHSLYDEPKHTVNFSSSMEAVLHAQCHRNHPSILHQKSNIIREGSAPEKKLNNIPLAGVLIRAL